MWLAILVGALIAVPFGLLVALPSLRIGDLYLALLTLGFALVIEQSVWQRPEYDNFGAGLKIARPFGLQITDRLEMYAIVAVVFAVVGLLIVNMKRATSGLIFAAIRSSEPASMTSGISIVRAKLVLFGISAFVAGLGGALYATVVGSATPTSFNALIGIVWLAIVVTWGVRSVTGALLAGMIYAIAPQRLSIILILIFFLAVGTVFTQLALGQAYRKVLGAIAMAIARGGGLRGQRVDLGQRERRRRGQRDPRAARARCRSPGRPMGHEAARSRTGRCRSRCSSSSPRWACGRPSHWRASTSANRPPRFRRCCSGSGPSGSCPSRGASSTTS